MPGMSMFIFFYVGGAHVAEWSICMVVGLPRAFQPALHASRFRQFARWRSSFAEGFQDQALAAGACNSATISTA